MIRFAVAVVFGPALLVSTVVGFAQGNPLAWGMAIGFAAPVLAAFLLVVAPAKPLPRKADPAKIARLERELGMGQSEAPTERHSEYNRALALAKDRHTVQTSHGAPQWGHKIGP